jgi:hypothetical protein
LKGPTDLRLGHSHDDRLFLYWGGEHFERDPTTLKMPLTGNTFFFLVGLGVRTQGRMLAQKAFYHLSHFTNLFLCWVFLR